MTRLWRRLLLVFLGVLFALTLVEVLMRGAGWLLVFSQEKRNLHSMRFASAEHGHVVRILCIGESTTAQGGTNSYPSQLERILNRRAGGRVIFSVINKGVVGASSGMLMRQLSVNVDKYKPDIIVAMMGINDEGAVSKYRPLVAREDAGLFESLRVVKLGRYVLTRGLALHGHMPRQSFAEAPQELPLDSRACAEYGWQLIRMGDHDGAEQVFRKALELNPTNDIALAGIGCILNNRDLEKEAIDSYEAALRMNPKSDLACYELGNLYLYGGDPGKAEGYFRRAAESNPRNARALMELAYLAMRTNDMTTSLQLLEKARAADPTDPAICGRFALYFSMLGRSDMAEFWRHNRRRVRKTYYNPVTVRNYQLLKATARERGILLVHMEYPVRSPEPLLKAIAPVGDAVVVSNEKAFKEALKTNRWDTIFTDNFAGEFGHCTPEGNRLIAENLAGVLISEFLSK